MKTNTSAAVFELRVEFKCAAKAVALYTRGEVSAEFVADCLRDAIAAADRCAAIDEREVK
jgi:hypothetical protein